MKVSLVPGKLSADGGAYPAIFVQIMSKGQVVPSPQDYEVVLTSSNLAVASVQPTLELRKGQVFGEATVTTTSLAGSSNITFASNGLVPTTMIVKTYALGGLPKQLATFLAPSVLLANSGVSYYFFIQLRDVNGTPTSTPTALNVALTSSAPTIFSLEPTVSIPAHGSYAAVTFAASSVGGSSILTAQLNDRTSSSLVAKSLALNMSLTLTSNAGKKVLTGSQVVFNLTAASAGVPIGGANVAWSVKTSGDTFTKKDSTTDGVGSAAATLNAAMAGNTTVTAVVDEPSYAEGSASLTISVVLPKLTVVVIPDATFVNASQSSGVAALVTSGGKPVAGAQVTWSSSLGAVNPGTSSTDATGRATASFVSPSNGNATITAEAAATGYASATATATITVGPSSPAGGTQSTGGSSGILGLSLFGIPLVAIVGVVVLVLVFVFVRRRRRRGPKEKEAPEEEAASEEGV